MGQQEPDSGTPEARRELHRQLASEGLSVRDISHQTGHPKSTVHRDLADWTPEADPLEPEDGYIDAATIQPIGRTSGGAVFYAPGRFDSDETFIKRVHGLRDMPRHNARILATRQRAKELSCP